VGAASAAKFADKSAPTGEAIQIAVCVTANRDITIHSPEPLEKHVKKNKSNVFNSLNIGALALAIGATLSNGVQAADPVKVGMLLPYTGTYAALGEAITNDMNLAIEQKGVSLGGRPVEVVTVDS